jgi:hypothetical protein
MLAKAGKKFPAQEKSIGPGLWQQIDDDCEQKAIHHQISQIRRGQIVACELLLIAPV